MTLQRSRDQGVLIGVAVAIPLLVLVVVGLAGSLAWWMPLLIVVVVVAALTRQDSYVDSMLLVAVVGVWVAGGNAGHPFATLGVALLVLTLHAALAMRAAAPLPAAFDRLIWRRWLGRVAVLAAITAAAWELTWALQRADLSGTAWASIAALLACCGFALLLRRLMVKTGD